MDVFCLYCCRVIKRKVYNIYSGILFFTFDKLWKQQQPTLPGLVSWFQHGSGTGTALHGSLCFWAGCWCQCWCWAKANTQHCSHDQALQACPPALLSSPVMDFHLSISFTLGAPVCCSLATGLSIPILATGLWSQWVPQADHYWCFQTYQNVTPLCSFNYLEPEMRSSSGKLEDSCPPEVRNKIHKAG